MKSQSQFGPLHWWTATLPSDNTRLFAEPASRATTSPALRIGICQENGGDSSAYLNVEAALAFRSCRSTMRLAPRGRGAFRMWATTIAYSASRSSVAESNARATLDERAELGATT